MLKKIFTVAIFALVLVQVAPSVFADQIDDCASKSAEEKVTCYSDKIAVAKGQQQTLSSQITVINSQIEITKLNIESTEQKLGRLTDDIASVSGKIDRLEESLQEVSNILANRIVKTYTAGRTDPLIYLLGAGNFQDLLDRLDYLRIVQKHDKNLMYEMASSRKNYNDQKSLLVDRKAEVETLSKQLKDYRASLDAQNRTKQKLLADTQGDEARYSQLLSQAKAQLASFSGFIDSQGGSSILTGQTSCNDWGCYYNQRDVSWGNFPIGLSRDSMKEYGCLVTSAAMLMSHYHKNVTPGDVARSSDPFYLSTAYMRFGDWSINGGTFHRESISRGDMDSELSAGNPVIVGIGAGPDHFIVIKSKSGDDYIMNDPFVPNGHDISFKGKYSTGMINAIYRVRVS
jgi:peptidoglycan hydrolase CwlO-like protein